MKNQTYDRAKEDSDFKHPNDEIIPAATPEDIEAQKADIERIKGDIALDQEYGLEPSEFSLNELKAAESKLELMMTGEEKINPCECNVYDAVFLYLKKCFELDKKYIKTAQADWDINEVILKDVLASLEKEGNNG